MAENKGKDIKHASDLYVEVGERDVNPEQSPKYPLEVLKN